MTQSSKLYDDFDINLDIERPGVATKNILEEDFQSSSLGEFFGNEQTHMKVGCIDSSQQSNSSKEGANKMQFQQQNDGLSIIKKRANSYDKWLQDLRPELKHIKINQETQKFNSFAADIIPLDIETHDQNQLFDRQIKQTPKSDGQQVLSQKILAGVKHKEQQNQKQKEKIKQSLPQLITRTTTLTQSLLQTSISFNSLSEQCINMQKQTDDAFVYFTEELFSRLKTTADLIKQLQKQPSIKKLKNIKRKLIQQNLNKQKEDQIDFIKCGLNSIQQQQYYQQELESKLKLINQNEMEDYEEEDDYDEEEEKIPSQQSKSTIIQMNSKQYATDKFLYNDDEIIDIGLAANFSSDQKFNQ